jgi:hypothetical protein
MTMLDDDAGAGFNAPVQANPLALWENAVGEFR